ncbi:chain length determination protein [Pasteurellaceae bacterium Macca]|nr:chain length determination protein [Pasteurellaceae bacterium Macca]
MSKATHDEIDLIDLITLLWKKKLIIVLTTFVFTLLAGVYAFTAKEKWTSQAEIIAPRIHDLGNYMNVKKEYAQILRRNFDMGALVNGLFSKFDRLIYSFDEREAFISQSEVFNKLNKNSEIKDEDTKRKILANLIVENISIIKPDAKKNPDAIGKKVTFSAQTPALAKETLSNFIEYVSNEAVQLDVKEFTLAFQESLKDIKIEKSRIELDLSVQKNIQLENLKKALEIAKKAGIKEYSSVVENNGMTAVSNIALSDTKIPLSDSKLSNDTYLFMLGEKYLQAQIDVIENQGIIYPPRYYQLQEELAKLKQLEPALQAVKARAYSYQSSPSYPVNREAPKRMLIISIALVLGFILSSLFIIILSFCLKRK